MKDWNQLLQELPQKPPFRFVDKVVSASETHLEAQKFLTGTEEFFQGHFPGLPIMPGVLLCEAVFQAGALLMMGRTFSSPSSRINETNDQTIGVVTRIRSTKFKHFVRPQDTLQISVELTDQMDHVFHMKGQIRVAEKLVLSVEFSGAQIQRESVV